MNPEPEPEYPLRNIPLEFRGVSPSIVPEFGIGLYQNGVLVFDDIESDMIPYTVSDFMARTGDVLELRKLSDNSLVSVSSTRDPNPMTVTDSDTRIEWRMVR